MDTFTPFQERPLNGGIQKLYRFDNGFGASVVRHMFSYGWSEGLWELAVLKFDGDDWHLTYSTEITSDVEGYLSNDDVDAMLRRISELAQVTA